MPLETLEQVPLVGVKKFNELTLYAKRGDLYPTGSAKYRVARRMVEDAIGRGDLRPGMSIIEVSSGNTGLALAHVGKELGYPVIIVVGPECTQDSKDKIKESGGTVVEVDGFFNKCEIELKRRMQENSGHFYWTKQVSNPSSLQSNVDIGHEIWNQMQAQGKVVDIFLASMGTGSTITGVGTALRAMNRGVRIYLVVPDGEYDVPGVDDPAESTVEMDLFDPSIIADRVKVSQEEAISGAKALAQAGFGVGISSGAVFAAAQKISRTEKGNAVMIFMDKADRYTDMLGRLDD